MKSHGYQGNVLKEELVNYKDNNSNLSGQKWRGGEYIAALSDKMYSDLLEAAFSYSVFD